MPIRLLVLLALLSTALLAPPASRSVASTVSLLTNGGFEAPAGARALSGLVGYGDAYVVDASVHHSGGSSSVCEGVGAAGHGARAELQLNQTHPAPVQV